MSSPLQKLRPIHRSLVSLALSLILFFVLPGEMKWLLKLLAAWCGFAISYLACCWAVIPALSAADIRKVAGREDGSKAFVFSMILLAAISSFGAVFLVIASQQASFISKILTVVIMLSAMLLSWALVHTMYVFHYAHLYYAMTKSPLEFPDDEAPDYMDFAYFSFVLGCTFQVSDVQINDKKMRRIALFHGLLSFVLNTFVIALSINIISGMVK